MDFRTCPACQASILEDDVDDCPFCGASLSGKSAKPKATPPAAAKPSGTKPSAKPAATTTSKPAPTKPSTTSRRAESDDEDDDADPFEVDTSAVRDAHPISPKRTKTTPLPVTCPMCETSGFISPRLAGKEVKCCNPDCMVPVFKAPPLPKKEEVVVEAPQGMSLASKITMGVMGLLVLIGAWVAYSVITGEDGDPGSILTSPTTPVDDGPGETGDPDENGEQTPVVDAGPRHTFEDIQSKSLAEMFLQAQRQTDEGSPLLGRQMIAEVRFLLGNEADGREALGHLRAAARGRLYFEAAPLAELAWYHFAEGDEAAANGVIDEALAAAAELPTVSRQSLDDATLLCAALCRAERWDDALGIVRLQRTSEPRGRTSALWRGALEFRTFDFSEEFDRPYLMDMPDSLSVAITRTLCARGAWDEAWTWTTKVDGEDVRHNCQAAWAGALTIVSHRSGDAELLGRLDAAISGADPVGQARMWAAVADGHLVFKKRSEADAALADAVESLAAVPLPAPSVAPSMRAIHDSKGTPFAGLADPAHLRSLALAWADVGHVQVALEQAAPGWMSFASSLDALRGTTPSPAVTQSFMDECDNQMDEVKRRLAASGVNDSNRTGYYQYRGQCEVLDSLADQRFEQQRSLLARAVDLGLFEPAWEHVKQRAAATLGLDEFEPWYTSTLPGRIVVVASRASNQNVIGDIRSTIMPPPRPTPLDDAHHFLLGMTATTPTGEISDVITSLYANPIFDDDVLDARFLDIVTQVFHDRGIDDAIDLARKGWTRRPSVTEDALRLITGLAIVSGRQDAIWDAYLGEKGRLNVTEKVAMFRGLIDGIHAVRQSEAASQSPAESVEE